MLERSAARKGARIWLACAASALLLGSGIALAGSLSATATIFSEPVRLGVAEAHGRPGLGLTLDWEAESRWFVGVNGYYASDAPAPQRPENIVAYAGVNWGNADAIQYDLTLLHRVYPGDSGIWDYTEVRLDIGLSPQIGLALTATDDFYGMDAASYAALGEYMHEFTTSVFARVEAGYVYIDSAVIDSYGFVSAGAGIRDGRWLLEASFRTNNAKAFPAFQESQIDDGFLLSLAWLLY